MAARKCIEFTNRKFKYTSFVPELYLHVGGVPFAVDGDLLASKSSKVAALLKENPRDNISCLLKDIPADAETFELVARFCHGYEVNITTDNVFHVACLAHYFGMTENHSTNNLLRQAEHFFEHQVLHNWNKSIRALKSAENILQHTVHLSLVDDCVESMIRMVLENPCVLVEPFKDLIPTNHYEEGENVFRPNVKRKLFALDQKYEDLTVLSLMLYEPIIHAMIQRQVPLEFVSASIYLYAMRWILSGVNEGDDSLLYKRKSQGEIIEAIERLLPSESGLPSTMLFELLHYAIALDSSFECRNGFEVRIGKQLHLASVNDLLILFQKEEKYGTESTTDCIKRILKNFYHNYTATDNSGLVAVAELMEKFLVEVASDANLKMCTFITMAEIAIAASAGVGQTSDVIYRAIDIYLDAHRYLTESEREEVCKVLDCSTMSAKACEHAAQNSRLPLRVVVQVLFVAQLKLQDAMKKEVEVPEVNNLLKSEEEDGVEEVRAVLEKMSSKVLELEKECDMMKRERQGVVVCRRGKNEKVNMWKEMKRKFGCMSISSSINDCNCHVKNNNKKKKKKVVHPR